MDYGQNTLDSDAYILAATLTVFNGWLNYL